MKVTVILVVIGTLSTGTRGLGHKLTSRDHPDYSVIKISQNSEKSPEDLRMFAVP